MQDAHLLLCQLHFLHVQHIAVLETLVLPGIVEPLPLDSRHVQHVKLGHGLLQRGGLRVGNALVFKDIVADKAGNLQFRRGNQHKANPLVTAHGFNQGMHGTTIFQIAADADGQIVQSAQLPGNGQNIRKGLGGVVVTAVTGIDDRDAGSPGGNVGRALLGVPHGDDIGVAADHPGGIGHALALGGGGGTGLAEAQHRTAQLHHSRFKAQSGTGGRLEKQGRQLLVGAFIPVGFRMGNDVLGGGDQLVQFFYTQFQNAVQTSHAFAPFTAR